MRRLICLCVILAVIIADRGVVKAPSGMGGIKGIVTLHAAEAEYHFDNGRFATSLQELGDVIDRKLATGEKDGYRFTLVGTPAGYAISATPVEPGKSYFSDQNMQIHVHWTGPRPDDPQGETWHPQESDPVAPRRDKTNS